MLNTCIPLKLNIVVVTFNMLDGLERTLASINNLAKTFPYYDLKAIVVNGNPNDDGHLVVAEFPDLVSKYIAESDRGIYDAMNKGILHLPDDGYTIFINSDDELINIPSSVCEDVYDVIFCDVLSHDLGSDLREVFKVSNKKALTPSNLLRPRIHHQGCFVRSSILKNYKYDMDVGIRADVLLMGNLLKNHSSFFQNEVVAMITTGGKSDDYNLSNFLSFFRVSDKLEINKVAVILLSSSEILKYTLKGLLGRKGVLLVRKVKFFILNSYIWTVIKGDST